ncbi:uncharacterized protein [Antedon mediterranea]|uniref:uncharacterized protein n=1 Tax=Antedon mediterranea TaxID=105859 RepID=UPI003AF6C0EE
MEYYSWQNETCTSKSFSEQCYEPLITDSDKVRKRREADAKCRANIAECYRRLKAHVHLDSKLSKARVLQESLLKIYYLEAIVSLQLQNLQIASPFWKQVTLQSFHQEFIEGYKEGVEMKKKTKKSKMDGYAASSNSTKVNIGAPAAMYTDQVVPSSPVDYQYQSINQYQVHFKTSQLEPFRQQNISSMMGGNRITCITPDLTCNEVIIDDISFDKFQTPKNYPLILQHNAPKKCKPPQDGTHNNRKRKLDFGESDDYVVEMFRNKKRKADKKRLKKQNSSARTRPWVWVRIIQYYRESEDCCDEEEIDVVADFKPCIHLGIPTIKDEPFDEEGYYVQQMNDMDDDEQADAEDDGILTMILAMENEFSSSSSPGCLDTFMGNNEDDDQFEMYGIMTSNESSSTHSSPVAFTDVAMDTDFFNAVKFSDFQQDMLPQRSQSISLTPSDKNSMFCFENDEDLSSGDLTCYEDDLHGTSSFSLQKNIGDMGSVKCNELEDSKESIMRWFNSADYGGHKEKTVNFSSLDYSPSTAASSLANQVVPQLECEEDFADMFDLGLSPPIKWILPDDQLVRYEGLDDIH